ncbi:SusD/RagB family nutrient-binding outer membrane lipoprotein [Chryseolinea soli]|uniref:SusD/RagB family nutrient-binding outer membrane lipoprotein n=1 Tax=Chryseolinea soli TaxID=2321403 RepID=A0A385SJC7_9BACT|nr:SusD/RagB family nutrient-binding outer membrane lipoprotein [Chryseolinea soli]AYB31002.1 SusD/RagB family nutrient-binding outer membrane lipoprotein [Chryseolinea soli]
MKRTFTIISRLVLIVAIMVGCTNDFESINTDPTKSSPSTFDSNYFLSNAQWTYADGITGYSGPVLFQSGWVQLLASTSSGGANYYSNMDKYVPSSNTNSYQATSWNQCYRSGAFASEMIKNTETDPEKVNITAVGRIVRVMSVHYITDVYGDAPYSQAWKANSNVSLPEYDTQQNLYKSLLADLDGALTSMDASKAIPSADIFYKGDFAKWKKFGYSLMLRIAMRLTKADAATAKTYAEKAAAGGTFASAADDAYVIADNANGYRNNYAGSLMTAADYYQVRWSKTLIDYLSSTSDPRLGVIAEVPQDGLKNNQDATKPGNSTPAAQLGLPNGFDLNGGATDITTSPGYPGGTGSGADATPIGKYSRPKTAIYGNFNAPVFVVTYAQTELLLAEAAVRGYNVGGSAAEHYGNGVEGAMLALAPFGAAATIDAAVAANYAAAHPLIETSNDASLKMINEQYWATSGALMNFAEAWNNWKRSGYPVLTPVVASGNFSNGAIPRREPYPTTESTLNTVNYKAAVDRLDGKQDSWSAKVWWDQ